MSPSPTDTHPNGPLAVDVARRIDEGDWGGYQRWLIALTALTIVFDGIDNQLLGVAIPAIMQEWGAPRAAFAPIVSIGYGGLMVGSALAGLAGDRLGRRTALLGSMILFGAMTAAAALAGSPCTWRARVSRGSRVSAAPFPTPRARGRVRATTASSRGRHAHDRVCAARSHHRRPARHPRARPSSAGARSLHRRRDPGAVRTGPAPALPESPRYLTRHPHRWPELARTLGAYGSPDARGRPLRRRG